MKWKNRWDDGIGWPMDWTQDGRRSVGHQIGSIDFTGCRPKKKKQEKKTSFVSHRYTVETHTWHGVNVGVCVCVCVSECVTVLKGKQMSFFPFPFSINKRMNETQPNTTQRNASKEWQALRKDRDKGPGNTRGTNIMVGRSDGRTDERTDERTPRFWITDGGCHWCGRPHIKQRAVSLWDAAGIWRTGPKTLYNLHHTGRQGRKGRQTDTSFLFPFFFLCLALPLFASGGGGGTAAAAAGTGR